ncbi:hypothetical protein Tco_0648549 [Tanacetum coccineum]
MYIMTSRPRTRIPSRPPLGCDNSLLLSHEDPDTRLEPRSYKESPEEKKHDDDDNHQNDDALIIRKRMGILETRKAEKQTPIPTPLDLLGLTYLRIRSHGNHPNDDALLREIDEDEVISEEASPEFLEELKSIGEKKVLTITDHHIMEATLNDTIRNQYKIATEEEDLMSLIHEKEAPIFFGPQRDPNEPPRKVEESLNIVCVARYGFKDPPLGELDKEIMELFDTKIKKVLKKVYKIICVARYGFKDPPLGELDREIMELFDTKIKKRLKHQRHMRRWENFVNERPILSHKVCLE